MVRIHRTFTPLLSLRWFFSAKAGFASLVLALLLAGCAGGEQDLYPTADNFQIHGIDVSKYQGDINWNEVRNSGVKFVWIKATEGGDYLDNKFAQNWMLAKQVGIPHGAYHFMYWCRPAEEQAQWFIQNVPKEPDALPPVLDVEWNPMSKTCPRRVSSEVARAEMKIILDAMERAYGKKPVIYTSVDFYRDVLKDALTDYPMWVRCVKTYPAAIYGSRRWHFWQHSAHAHVPGIRGNVDENAFYGSPREWRAFLATTASG